LDRENRASRNSLNSIIGAYRKKLIRQERVAQRLSTEIPIRDKEMMALPGHVIAQFLNPR